MPLLVYNNSDLSFNEYTQLSRSGYQRYVDKVHSSPSSLDQADQHCIRCRPKFPTTIRSFIVKLTHTYRDRVLLGRGEVHTYKFESYYPYLLSKTQFCSIAPVQDRSKGELGTHESHPPAFQSSLRHRQKLSGCKLRSCVVVSWALHEEKMHAVEAQIEIIKPSASPLGLKASKNQPNSRLF